MAGALATQYVEFVTKGLEKVTAGMDGLKQQLSKIGNLATGLQAALAGMAFEEMFSGTAEGEQFANVLDLLKREMASALLPVMDAVTRIVEALIPVMSSVAEIVQPLLEIITDVLLAVILPALEVLKFILDVLSIPVKLLISVWRMLGSVIMEALGPAMEFVKALFAELQGLLTIVNKFLGIDNVKKRDVGMAGGGHEDVQATFKRVQEAALTTGGSGDPAERAAKAAEEMNAKMGESLIKSFVMGLKEGAIYIAKALNPFSR